MLLLLLVDLWILSGLVARDYFQKELLRLDDHSSDLDKIELIGTNVLSIFGPLYLGPVLLITLCK